MCDREERIKELERKVEELEKRIRGRRMYQSPIEIFRTFDDMVTKFSKEQDELIVRACMNVGVDVDRDELIKALDYDRHQYEKGYADGRIDERKAQWHKFHWNDERLKDRYWYLVAHKDYKTPIKAQWRVGECFKIAFSNEMVFEDDLITHWMELPEMPSEVADEDD